MDKVEMLLNSIDPWVVYRTKIDCQKADRMIRQFCV